MRDSTSPTRMPPRAMQMIWLKSKPDSCTVSARRSTSALYCSQLTCRSPTPALLEGMAAHDGLGAVGAGRHHRDRHARQFFDAREIGARIRGELIEALHADGAVAPSRQRFVHGRAFGHGIRAGGQE